MSRQIKKIRQKFEKEADHELDPEELAELAYNDKPKTGGFGFAGMIANDSDSEEESDDSE